MSTQRVIVGVKWGPFAGNKAVIAPGEALRVGRDPKSDLVIENDKQMSARHVEIAWDGQRCRFRDLKSIRGTLWNGASGFTEGELRSGDWLKVGETVLTVHLEGATPPRGEVSDDDDDDDADDVEREEREERKARAARAEEALPALREAAKKPLYAVLDSARDRRILELCRESVEEHRSLYDGMEGETLAHVAPYLVKLSQDSRLLTALVREGWGKRWGIYLTSPEPWHVLRRHLRRYLMVWHEGRNERVYFRFYDPAVLGVFLPVTTATQRTDLFKPIGEFIFEDERGAVTIATAAA
jgi:hypothetical protein